MRASQGPGPLRRSDGQANLAGSAFFNASGLSIEQDFDAVFAQNLRDLVGHVLIFASEQLRRSLDYCHATAEAPEHLPEFEADVTSAQNQQILGQFVQLHDRSRIERREDRKSVV